MMPKKPNQTKTPPKKKREKSTPLEKSSFPTALPLSLCSREKTMFMKITGTSPAKILF